MIREFGKVMLETDFEYRIIKENESDVDVFVDLNYRALDVYDFHSSIFHSRIQFPYVRAIVLRIDKSGSICTLHLLRDIDMFSAFANFEVSCENSKLNIKNQHETAVISKSDR